jgi:hypothetical protein
MAGKIDSACSTTRVQGREDEVACLGSSQRNRDRLEVAQLSDEDHVRVMAQGRAQCTSDDQVSAPTSRRFTTAGAIRASDYLPVSPKSVAPPYRGAPEVPIPHAERALDQS